MANISGSASAGAVASAAPEGSLRSEVATRVLKKAINAESSAALALVESAKQSAPKPSGSSAPNLGTRFDRTA